MRGRPPTKIVKGTRFGKLTVIQSEGHYHGGIAYLCACACNSGKRVVAGGSQLKRGLISSCGCKRSSPKVSGDHHLFVHARLGAKQRNFIFSLPFDLFCHLIKSPCCYCGSEGSLVKFKRAHGLIRNGIDRVDNIEGYTPANTVSCCWLCNLFKGQLSVSEFLAWTKAVYAKNIRIS